MRPGDILDLEVASIGTRGDGVAVYGDTRVFLPFTVPGDKLRARIVAKRGEGFAGDVVELLSEGPVRRIPDCRHFGVCGGCALQHVAAEAYASWKRELVVLALQHRGLRDIPVEACITSPPGSRRRAKFAVLRVKDRMLLGFHERASDRIVDIDMCPVLSPALVAVLAPLRSALSAIGVSRADVGLLETETGLDVLIEAKGEPSLKARQALAGLAESGDFARLTWRPPTRPGMPREDDPIAMRRAPVLRFGDVPVTPPPDAFAQATKQAEDSMVVFVRDALAGATRVADLFAGCGTFTFPLARMAPVTSIDGDDDLIAAARHAAHHASGLKVIDFQTRDLFRRPLAADDLKPFDAVVFDPPRQGAKAQAEMLATSRVPVVVGVSCDPGTFARDARILVDGGYRLMRVQPIDQFLWSPHVELVVEFRRE
jgi:23S rRNA (uracil1939-C5)-methyltransferase